MAHQYAMRFPLSPCVIAFATALAAVRVKARAPELAIVLLAGLLVKEWQMVRELAMLHAWLDSPRASGRRSTIVWGPHHESHNDQSLRWVRSR